MHLKPGGALLVKCFKDMGFTQMVEKFRTEFKIVKQVKPKASRDKSSEIFLLGRGLKNPVEYKSGSRDDIALIFEIAAAHGPRDVASSGPRRPVRVLVEVERVAIWHHVG